MKKVFHFKNFLQYFLQGLLTLGPIFITFYAFYWVVSGIDGLIPIFTYRDERGVDHVQNYGLGLVIVVLIVVIVGYFSSFFITNRIINFFDKILQKMPGIKHIYTTTRDFVEAFAGDKKKFTHNVLASIDDSDVWRVGFVTQEDMDDFGLKEYVAVYIPMAYSIAGNVYLVPKSRIKEIPGISSSEAMKFAVTGGVTHVDDKEQSL